MALKKDKQKVLGEVFDDERVKSFLQFQPPAGIDADYHVLEKAYRGMNVDNFATFLGFFVAEGRNINAANGTGKTLKQTIAGHRLADDYVAALSAHGAQ